ncbi:MAG: hypothetical protein ACREGA_00080, partial [Candidatus Saccharimonadales bacterium]
MDFTNRGADAHQTNPNQTSPANSSAPARPTGRPEKSRGRLATRYDRGSDEKLLRVVTVILLLSIAIILIFLAVLFYISPGDQGHYVKKNGYQAVDLSIGGANSGDQIYFAKITSINSRYFVLQNVFYIPSTQKNTNVTLSPLVCQIDAPYDQMIVN